MNKSALKRKAKRFLLKSLDVLPEKMGYDLYHQIQNALTEPFGVKVEANQRTLEIALTILEKNQIKISGKTVLEIGSGWMPLMPYLLKYHARIDKVFTYDIADHYQNKYIDELNAHFRKKGMDLQVSESGLHLPDFVEYHPNANVITAELPQKVDVIFSRFVLEHVTPTDMVAMHKRFAEKYGPETLILHFISPSDHRAFSDSTISHYDFLRYSQKEWNRIQTKFDYHNRLRLPQYLQLLEVAGMEVLYLEHDQAEPGSKKYDMFKRIPLHADYSNFSDVELTAGSINILLRPKSK